MHLQHWLLLHVVVEKPTRAQLRLVLLIVVINKVRIPVELSQRDLDAHVTLIHHFVVITFAARLALGYAVAPYIAARYIRHNPLDLVCNAFDADEAGAVRVRVHVARARVRIRLLVEVAA